MAQNEHYKSMVEIAEEIIRERGKQNLYTLIDAVGEIKGFSKDDEKKATLLYLDMTLSSRFVYCGNDEWDIKENNLEMWDKDGAFFAKDEVDFDEEDDEEEEEIILDEFYSITEDVIEDIDEEDEDEEDEDKEDKEEDSDYLLDDDIPFYSTDDDDVEEPEFDFDAEDYHDIMDDYEDMYDD